jgi:hypothetical protein
MFRVGQKVWHRDGQRSGTVLECDGDRVYIEQDNGAELDFPARELTTTPPASARPAEGAAQGQSAPPGKPGYVMPNRTLIAADITPEHSQVLSILPVRTLQAVAALHDRQPGARKFSSLDVAGKLNAVAAITEVPYRTMREYRDRPGELGLLMGKGIADRQRAG